MHSSLYTVKHLDLPDISGVCSGQPGSYHNAHYGENDARERYEWEGRNDLDSHCHDDSQGDHERCSVHSVVVPRVRLVAKDCDRGGHVNLLHFGQIFAMKACLSPVTDDGLMRFILLHNMRKSENSRKTTFRYRIFPR